MFLTCLLNSQPPAFKRNSFGIIFHCFAAKYLKEFKPYFVVFSFGTESILLPLRWLYIVFYRCLNIASAKVIFPLENVYLIALGRRLNL